MRNVRSGRCLSKFITLKKYYGFKILLTISLLLTLCGSVNPCPAKCRCYKTTKFSITCNCSWANLQRIPNKDVDVTTTKLLASHNNLTSLKNNTFSAFSQLRLTGIVLDYNEISDIDSNSFKDLMNLKQLSVSHNMIMDLRPDTFADTKQLQELYVSDNHLTEIHPKLLMKNTHLQVFDAANNRIRFLPTDLFIYNTNLKEVYVNDNDLSFLSNKQFQHNHELKTVHLENNNIIYLQLGTFGYSEVPLYVNFSNNAMEGLQSNTFQSNCHMAILNVDYKLGKDSQCQAYHLRKLVRIDIRANPLLCDSHLEEVAVLCCNYSTYIVRKCASGYPRISSAEFSGRRLQKRALDVTSLSENASGLTSSSAPVTTNYSATVVSPYVTDTAMLALEIKSDMSGNGSANMTQLFGQAYQPVSTLPSEEPEQNLTTVFTLIRSNFSLVVSESTARGMLFIGAESLLAAAIVLRNVVCSRIRTETDVGRMDLVSAQEAGTVRNMESCENGSGQRLVKSKGDADEEDIKFEDSSGKGDGDDEEQQMCGR